MDDNNIKNNPNVMEKYFSQLAEINKIKDSEDPSLVFTSYIFFIYNTGALNPFIEVVQSPFRILLFILTNGPCHPSEISDMLSLPRPNVAIALRQLESDELIKRETDPTDKRQCFISLTPLGLQKGKECTDNIQNMFSAWINSMTKEQQNAMFEIMSDTIKKIGMCFEMYKTPFFQSKDENKD